MRGGGKALVPGPIPQDDACSGVPGEGSRGLRRSTGMFTRCLVCQSPFPRNETLEHFPTGDRIAFDPARGRLWAVCRTCRRWSLAPIEDRWEALEELEKLVT